MPAGSPASPTNAATDDPWELGAQRWWRSDQLVDDDDNDRTAEMLGLVRGCRVLDAGCGAGRRAGSLAATGAHVVGVDLSAAMLQFAMGAGRHARLVRGNITELPFDADAWTPGLQALANGWRFLATAH